MEVFMPPLKIKYTGSGTSMGNAIYFSGAFSCKDYVRMQMMYINIKGLNVLNKFTKKEEDGFDYDVYLTPKGLLWFKKPCALEREAAAVLN
jgi:hypothetical protein